MSEEQSKSRYDIEQSLAQGGMGEVLEARDRHFGRAVAMKMIRSEREGSRDIRQRFVQEARILSQLEHPNIVPVHDLDQDEQGRVFYTMKLVHGVTLKQVIDGLKAGEAQTVAKYPLSQLLTIFQKVCDAVAFAHSKGIVHRDLKPENIMLGEYGEVLVMDWGLAKVLSAGSSRREEAHSANLETEGQPAENKSEPPHVGCHEGEEGFHEAGDPRPPSGDGGCDLTLDGQILGTPQFMAPEQAEGRVQDIDERSDVFSLGAILYSLLTLRPPTGGTTLDEVLDNIKSGYIPPPVIYNKARKRAADGSELESTIALAHCPGNRIPDSLSAVAMKAMAVDPEDRYQEVPELQAEIAAYQGGFATSAEQAGAGRRLRLWVRRNKILSAAAAVIVLLVGGFMAKVVQERNRAKAALVELRQAVPLIEADIKTLINQHKFEEALQRISQLLALMPQKAEYHALKGNLLQSLFRFEDAQKAYAQALTRDIEYPYAQENIRVSRVLARQTSHGHTPALSILKQLLEALNRQGRFAEASAITDRQAKNSQANQKALEGYKEGLRKAGVTESTIQQFSIDADGKLMADVRNTAISDLSPLAGLPIKSLWLRGAKVSDLSPLSGMPLETLDLYSTPIHDLSPLRGMKLRFLELGYTKVSDLGPLAGMPLEHLTVQATGVQDLSPLKGMKLKFLVLDALRGVKVADFTPVKGMPLELFWADFVIDLSVVADAPLVDLKIGGPCNLRDLSPLKGKKLVQFIMSYTQVEDLSPLAGMPLKRIEVRDCKVRDLSPLLGMPLEYLHLEGNPLSDIRPLAGLPVKELLLHSCPNLRDISPLAQCRQLELLTIPLGAQNIEVLRQLPKHKKLAYTVYPHYDWNKIPPVSEFWKSYDARKGKR